jgi:hypothetical protein
MEDERIRPNEPQAWIYWDVRAIDDGGDEDLIVEEHERVTVTMDSEADDVTLRDVNEGVVAEFQGRKDEEDVPLTHTTIFPYGVDILNVLTGDGRSVYLELRPHQDFGPPNT